jgi:hypothetical protein
VAPNDVGFFGDIPGWTVQPAIEGGRGTVIELQNNLVGPAFHGTQVLELDSFGPVAVSQDVPTIPGGIYQLGFSWSPRPGTAAEDNHFRVTVDGESVREVGPAAAPEGVDWQTETVVFTATDETTTLTFTDLGPQADPDAFNDVGALLDGVSLSLND